MCRGLSVKRKGVSDMTKEKLKEDKTESMGKVFQIMGKVNRAARKIRDYKSRYVNVNEVKSILEEVLGKDD